MVVPSEEFCGHHGLPNWAICVRSRHHERSILWSADSTIRLSSHVWLFHPAWQSFHVGGAHPSRYARPLW